MLRMRSLFRSLGSSISTVTSPISNKFNNRLLSLTTATAAATAIATGTAAYQYNQLNDSNNILAAEPASATASTQLPLVQFPMPTVGSPINAGTGAAVPIVRKRSSVRPPLPNPGKFTNNHRDCGNIIHTVSNNIFSGARFQFALPLFDSPDNNPALQPDKQVVLIPIILAYPAEMGGLQGQLHINTVLGNHHILDGMIDIAGNITGSHTYKNKPWNIRNSFSFIPQQQSHQLDIDYKGIEFTAQATLANFSEAVFSYNQQLTNKFSAGVQLALAPFVTALAGTVKYNNNEDIFAATYKQSNLIASYSRRVYTGPSIAPGAPPVSLSIGTELNWNTATNESQLVTGLFHQRNLFKFGANLVSDGTVQMALEQMIAPGIQLTLSGELKHDGSNESKFGMGIAIG